MLNGVDHRSYAHPRAAIILGGLVCLLAGAGTGWFLARHGTTSDGVTAGTASRPAVDAVPMRDQPGAGRSALSPHASQRAVSDKVEGQVADLALDAALECAGSPDSGDGIKCLHALARFSLEDVRVRAAFLEALDAEPDAGRKARILELMTPVPLAPEDLAPILEEIEAVLESEVPAVQSSGLISLAQWDRSDQAEARLREKLYVADADPAVTKAAITGLQIAGVRTQDTKDVLLLLADNASAGSEIQGAAIEALGRAQLNRGEYEIYRSAVQGFDMAVGGRK